MELLRSEVGLELMSVRAGEGERLWEQRLWGGVGATPVLFVGPLPGTAMVMSQSEAMVAWAEAMELQVQSSLGVCGGADIQLRAVTGLFCYSPKGLIQARCPRLASWGGRLPPLWL